jgi:UDP-N-acetylenolpyruvoylglucosamine reductase
MPEVFIGFVIGGEARYFFSPHDWYAASIIALDLSTISFQFFGYTSNIIVPKHV